MTRVRQTLATLPVEEARPLAVQILLKAGLRPAVIGQIIGRSERTVFRDARSSTIDLNALMSPTEGLDDGEWQPIHVG